MTQKEFANELCIAEGTLSSVFTGRTRPTNNFVYAIHERFPNVNISWLMFGEGDMFSSEDGDLGQPAAQYASAGSDMHSKADVAVQQDMFSTPPNPAMIGQAMQGAVKYIEKPMRKITEIRVFYDDGTYETFSA